MNMKAKTPAQINAAQKARATIQALLNTCEKRLVHIEKLTGLRTYKDNTTLDEEVRPNYLYQTS